MKVKEFGQELVGISFANGNGKVSFLTNKDKVKLIKEKLLEKENFSVKSFTGKNIVFRISKNLCYYIISDSYTGDTVSIYFEE